MPFGPSVSPNSWPFQTAFYNIAIVLQAIVATVAAVVVAVAQNRYCLYLLIREWTPVHSAKSHRQIVDTTAGRKYNFEVLANLLGYNLKWLTSSSVIAFCDSDILKNSSTHFVDGRNTKMIFI